VRHTDIAIVGGGMAGATAAAMLAKAGVDALLIDPHATYPADFRCEKLDQSQLALLAKTGVGDALLAAATPSESLWVARYGRVVERRPNFQVDALYDTMVNTMRSAIGGSVSLVVGKCTALTTSPDRQVVTLADGEEVSARLVILANGLNSALRRNMGLERKDISLGHSIGIGFDVAPVGRPRFDFRALTYYPERLSARAAYLSMFPLGTGTRANLFVYRDMRDAWLRAIRDTPVETLTATFPGLTRLTGPLAVTSFVNVRPVDLYVTTGVEQPGIVLVGDAYGTSCPAAGTGLNKALTDAERLVHHHLPGWLATPGMGVDKIAAFYADPEKLAADAYSAERAMFVRSISIDGGPAWRARRRIRYVGQMGVGALRAARSRLGGGAHTAPGGAVGTPSGR
jgi:2-polyprenyl-6-methoxyphenol hydroxylase-like FAD-dependent oxidoreductase